MNASPTHGVQFIAGNLALDFVNTVGDRLGEPHEYLLNADALAKWAQAAGLADKRAPCVVSRRQLEEVKTVREGLHSLFRDLVSGAPRSRPGLDWLNARLTAVAPKRELVWEKRSAEWRWNTAAQDPDRLLGPILFSAADILLSDSHHAVRQCDDDKCGWLFMDRSRAGRRRWCSMADCGNRAKARRFYRQQAAEARAR